ncbi:hypothetical protein SLEP1_g32375 [Rubroshorea leprosula]|uniref:MATH domain-containing protein n=1 Tax=Rubroshorea leprosula TaxID=152421 RepID=A0AAV5KD45_9ROSI|nr:hypothetical protein SLEP1_g32375 [Rubroshorea leprosula]
MTMEEGEIKFIWKIQNFSKLHLQEPLCSKVFSLGDYKWRIVVSSKENMDHLSIYLQVVDSLTLPSGWSRNTKFSFIIVNQIDDESSVKKATPRVCKFDAQAATKGSTRFISLEKLRDLEKGYLVEDTCIIEADVTMFRGESPVVPGPWSGNTAPIGRKDSNDEIATGCKLATENPTEEDINAFFVDLGSEISSGQNLSPKEELKEALTRINDTLNMDPADLNDAGRIYKIKNAFDVLSSLDTYSVLTTEQKEVLTMKEKIIDLPERAAKASKDKKLFAHKEFVKMTLHRKLGRCLIEFKRTKEETEQQERNIATLQEKVDSLLAEIGEARKKKCGLSSKQKEMYKLSKDLKAELDELEKQWPEYEAKMKAAEEEEKMVHTEWHKMKQIVSSLNKTLYPFGFRH